MGYAYWCNRCKTLYGDDEDPPRAFEAEVPEYFIENVAEGADFKQFHGERIDLCVDCTYDVLIDEIEDYDPADSEGHDE